jgi:hypothetical protein
MRSLPCVRVLVCVSLTIAGRGAAQTAPHPGPLTAGARRDVVDTIAAQLERFYVDADTGRLIAAQLRQRLTGGAYDKIGTTAGFADALTSDLRGVNGDLHLSVQYAPDQPTDHPGSRGLTTPGPRPPGAAPDPNEPELTPALLAEWRRSNFGLERAERLEGNVGYIRVRGFYDGPEAYAATGAALAFLERTDAIIFDLRDMPGGSGDMSNWLLSHFTGTDSVASLAITNRSAGDSVVRYTMAKVPGTKRPEVPLFILTSRGTASAGEDFTFVLHNLHRATVVGERTAGAGHNNAFLAAGHGFALSLSYTRVMDPRTGKEWERVGIEPDVAVEAGRALETAHALALRAIDDRTTEPARKRELALTAETLEARVRPHRIAPKLLASYAGMYGERTLSLRSDTLVFRRLQYRSYPLIPLNDSTFALGSIERLTIQTARGKVLRFRLVREDGDTIVAERTGPPPHAGH